MVNIANPNKKVDAVKTASTFFVGKLLSF